MKSLAVVLLVVLIAPLNKVLAQDSLIVRSTVIDYNQPKNYIIGGIKVSGIKYLRPEQVLSLTGFTIGDSIKIPSEEVSSIIKRIWMARFFSDVSLYIDSTIKDTAYLNLFLKERPRVSRWEFSGVKTVERSDLTEKLKLRRGGELSDYIVNSTSEIIRKYYVEKGFLQTVVSIRQEQDSTINNAVKVTFVVDRKMKVKIKKIIFEGNINVKGSKLASSMKKTKDMRLLNFFSSKKFNEKEFVNDKALIIQTYNERGYRDAKIVKDSIYYIEDGRMCIHFTIDEGKRYYFRNITWTGNSIFPTEALNNILRIKKGDIYDVVSMEDRLTKAETGNVTKMYTDYGYLFFNVSPVELKIEQDSVDVEMRLYEGKPATFNRIVINGNNITNEKIARREIFTKPGYLYSQSDVERKNSIS